MENLITIEEIVRRRAQGDKQSIYLSLEEALAFALQTTGPDEPRSPIVVLKPCQVDSIGNLGVDVMNGGIEVVG